MECEEPSLPAARYVAWLDGFSATVDVLRAVPQISLEPAFVNSVTNDVRQTAKEDIREKKQDNRFVIAPKAGKRQRREGPRRDFNKLRPKPR
jgi:hypothetical protein